MASKDLTLLESVYNEMYQEEAPTVRDLGTQAQQISVRTQQLRKNVAKTDLNDPAVTSQLQSELSSIMNDLGQLFNTAVNAHGGSGVGSERLIRSLTTTRDSLKEIQANILAAGNIRDSVYVNEFLLTINEAINFTSSSLKLLL